MEKFWMVYLDGGGAPTATHNDIDQAKREAERLARKYGKRAFVLESKLAVELETPPVKWTDTDKEPELAF